MSKALAVLKLFFSLVSINTTAKSPTNTFTHSNSTIPITPAPMPLLINPVDSLSSFVGQAFEYKVPDDTFHPIGKLKLSMLTVNKGQISSKSWLRFNSKTSKIYGLPLQGNAGKFKFYLKATNEQGMTAEDVISLHVREAGGQYNHEFVLKTAFNLATFVSNLENRFVFIKRFARYTLRSSDVSTIWIKSYNKERKQITIAFNTVRYSPCNKGELQKLRNKFVTSSGGIRSDFQRALSSNYPLTGVDLRYLGPCDPPTPPPPPPFEWGILKHILPVLMLLFVIGLPVGISCAVRKRSERRRAKLLDQLKKKRREEENGGFTFHTVHYNNRYPSMLSMSNNSREEEQTGDSDNSNSKTMLNGSVPSNNINGMTTAVVNNGPTNNATVASPKNERAAGTQNTENKPINVDVKQPNSVNLDKPTNKAGGRIVYMGKSDMNIPVYYTKPKEEEPESEMSFFGIVGTISSTITGIGKSVLNIAGQGEEEVKQSEQVKVNNAQERTSKDNNVVLLSSELQLPLAVDGKSHGSRRFSVQNIDTEIGKVHVGGGIPKRSRSEMRLSDLAHRANHEPDYGMLFDERSNITGTLMSPSNVRMPMRGLSMPHLDIASQAEIHNYSGTHAPNVPLKSCLKHSQSSMAVSSMIEQTPMQGGGMVIGDLTHQIEQMSREMRKDFGTHGNENVYYTSQHFDEGQTPYQQTAYSGGQVASSVGGTTYSGEGAMYPIGGSSYTAGETVYSAGHANPSGGPTIYSNGQTVYSDGNPVYSDGGSSYNGGNIVYPHGQTISSGGQIVYSDGQTVYSSGGPPYTDTVYAGEQNIPPSGQVGYSDSQTVYSAGGPVYSGGETLYSGEQTISSVGQTVSSGGQTVYSAGGPVYTGGETPYSGEQTISSGVQTVYSNGGPVYTDGETSYSGRQTISSEEQTISSGGQTVYSDGGPVYTDGSPYSGGQTISSGGQTAYSAGGPMYTDGGTPHSGGQTISTGGQTAYSAGGPMHTNGGNPHSGGQTISTGGQTAYSAGGPMHTDGGTPQSGGQTISTGGQTAYSAGGPMYTDGGTPHSVGQTISTGGQIAYSAGGPMYTDGGTPHSSGQTISTGGQTTYSAGGPMYTDGGTPHSSGQTISTGGQTAYSCGQTSLSVEKGVHSERPIPGGNDNNAMQQKDDDLSVGDEEAMDYTTWRRRKIQQAEREAQLRKSQTAVNEYHTGNEEYHSGNEQLNVSNNTTIEEPAYEDYVNPYQYANGSSRTGRAQTSIFPSHDSGLSEDYQKDNRYKQQPPNSPLNSRYSTHSMPSLTGDHNHFAYSASEVDNKNKLPQGNKSVRETPAQNKNLNSQPGQQQDDGSLVGFLKTTVGGILGPSDRSSWFK